MNKEELNKFLNENFEELPARYINGLNPYGLKFTNNENQLKNWIEDRDLMADFQEWFKKYPGKNQRDRVYDLFLSSYKKGVFASLYKDYPTKNIKAQPLNLGYRSLTPDLPCRSVLKKLGFTVVEATIRMTQTFNPIIFMDAKNENEYLESLMQYAKAVKTELKTEEENP